MLVKGAVNLQHLFYVSLFVLKSIFIEETLYITVEKRSASAFKPCRYRNLSLL